MPTPSLWLLVGSQHLYGDDILLQVEQHAQEIASSFAESGSLPLPIVFKKVLTTPEEITASIREANHDTSCAGLIIWMHTFSPAKMWINGLRILHKPLLHLHTQFNRDIPWHSIDMDFMNLNQSAHGDRETAHILTRMGIRRKTVTGHFRDERVVNELGSWSRAVSGWFDWQEARFVRFGDNMRFVAVTEGDKVEAQIRFGFTVNTHGVGDLVKYVEAVDENEITALCEAYADEYDVEASLLRKGARHQELKDAARIEAGLRSFLKEGNYKGFTTTFEDLHGLKQLPGIAAQRLMADGYGFSAEGDWKTAALVRLMKTMSRGLNGGNSFMEDYTYHLPPGNELVLGAHMLEICPSIAATKPRCIIKPLSIGGKNDPVRLVFDGKPGPAINVSMIDMGTSFRLLVSDVEAVAAEEDMPSLPVARVLWRPQPDFYTNTNRWLEAGGAHHTCFSQSLTASDIKTFAELSGTEIIHIH